jgi:hypothetical protein
LAINLIERFLEVKQISRKELQLLAIAATLIACKYEEVYRIPKIKDLVLACDFAYAE